MKKSIRRRRRFTADEKAAILRRHLADKVPMSEYGFAMMPDDDEKIRAELDG